VFSGGPPRLKKEVVVARVTLCPASGGAARPRAFVDFDGPPTEGFPPQEGEPGVLPQHSPPNPPNKRQTNLRDGKQTNKTVCKGGRGHTAVGVVSTPSSRFDLGDRSDALRCHGRGKKKPGATPFSQAMGTRRSQGGQGWPPETKIGRSGRPPPLEPVTQAHGGRGGAPLGSLGSAGLCLNCPHRRWLCWVRRGVEKPRSWPAGVSAGRPSFGRGNGGGSTPLPGPVGGTFGCSFFHIQQHARKKKKTKNTVFFSGCGTTTRAQPGKVPTIYKNKRNGAKGDKSFCPPWLAGRTLTTPFRASSFHPGFGPTRPPFHGPFCTSPSDRPAARGASSRFPSRFLADGSFQV